MAKFFGVVGYNSGTMETAPGVHVENVLERPYFGDVLRNTRQLQNGESVNDDLNVRNSISIVSDAYANEHFHAIRYVKWAGANWTVREVEVQSPRLLLKLGGVYNGPTPAVP